MMWKRVNDRATVWNKKIILLFSYMIVSDQVKATMREDLRIRSEKFLASIAEGGQRREQVEEAIEELEDLLSEEKEVDEKGVVACNESLRIAYLIDIGEVYDSLLEEWASEPTTKGKKIFESRYIEMRDDLHEFIYEKLCTRPFNILKEKIKHLDYSGFESLEKLMIESREIRLIHNYFTLFAYKKEKEAWITTFCKMLPKRWIEDMVEECRGCYTKDTPSRAKERIKEIERKFKEAHDARCAKYENLIKRILTRDGVLKYFESHLNDLGLPAMKKRIKKGIDKRDKMIAYPIGVRGYRIRKKTDTELITGSALYLLTFIFLCDGWVSQQEENREDLPL